MADTAVQTPAVAAPTAATQRRGRPAKAPVATKSPKPKAEKKAPKEKGEKKIATHPSAAIMVLDAVTKLADKKGSSLKAIKKFISDNNKVDVEKQAPFIRKAIKSAVVKGVLVQAKGTGASGSFKLPVKAKPEKKSAGAKKPKVKKAKATTASPKVKKAAPKKPTAVTPKKKAAPKKATSPKAKAPATKPAASKPKVVKPAVAIKPSAPKARKAPKVRTPIPKVAPKAKASPKKATAAKKK